jgi:hypothetical protein
VEHWAWIAGFWSVALILCLLIFASAFVVEGMAGSAAPSPLAERRAESGEDPGRRRAVRRGAGEPAGFGRPLLAVACGLGCFASAGCFAAAGGGILLTLALMPLVPLVALTAVNDCRGVPARLVFGATLGFALAWFGLVLNVEHFDWSNRSEYPAWEARYGGNDEEFETMMVAGFPIRGVEGHGGGGAREYLPPGKGLGVLIVNYLLCTAGACVLAFLPARRTLPFLIAAGGAVAFGAGLVGWWQLAVMLD